MQTEKVMLTVNEIAGEAIAGTGELSFSVDGAPFTTVAMTEVSENVYSAMLPAAECTSTVDYFFSVQAVGGETITSPSDAPNTTFSTIAAENLETPFETEFEVAAGFTAGVSGDTASTGVWERGDPNGTAAQPENDNTPTPGVNCFFTGQGNGGGQGENDVDGGFTTLLSPEIDLTAFDAATISYFRWYRNDTGDSPNADTFRVDIREAGSSTWMSVEVVGPGGAGTSGGWLQHEFSVSPIVSLPATVQLRFIAEDGGPGSIVEAAIDDLVVTGISCEVLAGPCMGDCDNSGSVDFNDLVAMLFEFGTPGADGCDTDDSGTVDFNDLVAALFVFGPCPL